MNNYDKLLTALESYQYSKEYYDIEKSIAKISLAEDKINAINYFNENKDIFTESNLEDYYISGDVIKLEESVGYKALSVINVIWKALKIILKGIGSVFTSDSKDVKTKDSQLVSYGYFIYVIPVTLRQRLQQWFNYDPRIVNKLVNVINRNKGKYNISCTKSKAKVSTNKEFKDDLAKVQPYMAMILNTRFNVDPIGKQYCSINIDELIDYLNRATAAKDAHDFKQLISSIKNSCNKSRNNGITMTGDAKINKSIYNKYKKIKDKVDDQNEKNDSNENDKKVKGEGIGNTLKLAHEAIAALKEVSSNTIKLYKNVNGFIKESSVELQRYFSTYSKGKKNIQDDYDEDVKKKKTNKK